MLILSRCLLIGLNTGRAATGTDVIKDTLFANCHADPTKFRIAFYPDERVLSEIKSKIKGLAAQEALVECLLSRTMSSTTQRDGASTSLANLLENFPRSFECVSANVEESST